MLSDFPGHGSSDLLLFVIILTLTSQAANFLKNFYVSFAIQTVHIYTPSELLILIQLKIQLETNA